MDNEDDIYGEDIYGTSAFDRSQTAAGSSGAAAPSQPAPGGAAASALEAQLAERDATIGSLQARLAQADAAVEAWRGAFREASSSLDGRPLEPAAAAAEMRRLRAAADRKELPQQPVDPGSARHREALLQQQLAERNLENIELRRQAHAARQCTDPSISQLRQLLLDPAVAREFARLRGEAEAKAGEAKGLQEELQAVQFSQESKAGRMLMAKCRALQDENEEMGRELAEGKVHALERQAALARTYVQDMRARYLELEDHSHALDAEAEGLHQEVFMLRRQLREAEARAPASRERAPRVLPAPPKFGGGGGGRDHGGGYGGGHGGGGGLPGPPGRSLTPHEDGRKRGPPPREADYGGGRHMR